ncbi:MAG: hypothetical protein ABW019_03070, partial [Chitinophagaceae bacterium]
MKKLKYIIALVALLGTGLHTGLQAQLIQNGAASPAGPYAGGTVITIPYSLDFLMIGGQQKKLNIHYNAAAFEFMGTDFSTMSNNAFQPTTPDAGFEDAFETPVFTSADNNYTSSSYFTFSFRVKSPSCVPVSENIVVEIKNSCAGCLPDIQSVITSVAILNTNSSPSVSLDLYRGNDCTTAMYKITSFGQDLDAYAGNSSFTLTLPAGATLQDVFDSHGNPVTPPITTGQTTFTWNRSGIPNEGLQNHFVIINFNTAVLCPSSATYDITVSFTSHNVCTQAQQTITATRHITGCCTTPFSGSGVVLSKTLMQYPLRYFPAPDNCRTHDYIIQVDNLTPNALSNFTVKDILGAITSHPDEIEVTGGSASLISYFGPASFSFTTNPVSNSGTTTITSPGSAQNLSYGSTMFPSPSISNWVLTGTVVFPKYSSLIIRITHRLVNPNPLNESYVNNAKLSFAIGSTPFIAQATCKSEKDKYIPFIVVEKNVRNLTDNGTFSYATNASPAETAEFEIRIKNYGMGDVTNVNLNDVITETGATNLLAPSSVTVTGTGYSTAELTGIGTAIGTPSANGFSCIIPKIRAAPCAGISELVIRYKAKVKSPDLVVCNSIYTNKITLSWVWNGNTETATDEAVVNVDLFKNILYRLEASCKGPDGPFQLIQANGIPGQPIWYRALVKNNNAYTINNFKMAVQLPHNGIVSTPHGSETLVSSAPLLPAGTNLHPELPVMGTNTGQSTVVANWLNTSAAAPTGFDDKVLYKWGTIPPGSEAKIIYKVIVPSNIFGSQYVTAMGVSIAGATCSIVKQDSHTLTVAQSNNCGAITGCDLILFNSRIERIFPDKFRVTLFDILGAYPGFNIDNIDIVIHQPYDDIMILPAPYNKPMIPYTTGPVTSSYAPFTVTQALPSERYYRVTNGLNPINFGSVSFDIQTTLPASFHHLVFPVNVVFKNKADQCTLCEKTIFLTYE